MKLTLWAAAIGALLAMPASALAQQPRLTPDPADARVAVPPALYESVFTGASLPGPEGSHVTPDTIWRAANDTVAAAPGHGGHGAEPAPASSDGHAGHTAPISAAKPAAKPVAQPAAGHGNHH